MWRWLKKEPSKNKLKAALKEAYEEIGKLERDDRELIELQQALIEQDDKKYLDEIKSIFKNRRPVKNDLRVH